MRARWQWHNVNMAACKKTADSMASSCFFACRLKSRYFADVLSAQKNLIEGSECYGPAEINLQAALGSKIDEDNFSLCSRSAPIDHRVTCGSVYFL